MAKKTAKKKGPAGKIAAGVLALALIGGAIGGDEPANNVADNDASTSISDFADQTDEPNFDTVESVDSSESDDNVSSAGDAEEETGKKEDVQDTKAEETVKQDDQKEESKDTGKEESVTTPPTQAEEKKPEPTIDPEAAFREKLKQYNYVCSTESDKYHKPSCRHTDKINDSNLAHFDTEDEAAAAGYIPCGTCKP